MPLNANKCQKAGQYLVLLRKGSVAVVSSLKLHPLCLSELMMEKASAVSTDCKSDEQT